MKSKRKSQAKTTPAPAPTKALTTRRLDFWLLGGASIAVWALMFGLDRVGTKVAPLQSIIAFAAVLALLITSPHFMASYALAYRKGWGFIRTHWFQLLLVPGLLLALMTWAWLLRERPSSASGSLTALNSVFESLGLRTRVGLTSSLSTEVLSLLVNVMFLTVGWHYTKQVYGSMMVYAAFDGLTLGDGQRRLLRVNLFLLWWLTFSWTNANSDAATFFGLTYFHLGLPPAIFIVTLLLLAISLVVVVARVFWPLYRQHRRLPGLNFLVPYVAMYVWWFPGFKQQEYYVYLVPVFHAAQYLAFVFKLEKTRTRELSPSSVRFKGATWIVGLLVASYLSFDLIPNSADGLLHARTTMGLGFFLVCAQVFINVHHYFIDNVLWRFDNPEIRKYLLA